MITPDTRAHTLIGRPDSDIYINMTGNLGMAKAGIGDMLTGTIVAMYGIGYRDVGKATRVEVLVHGLTGDLVAKDLGEDGVTPDDVVQYLPKALNILREEPQEIVKEYFSKIM